ncbi:Polysaccharide pyruvyl transferase [Selenomonas ruminantium]|uniref:Polysaccharide pyruvyl transferase n=2 Tax=Selenomonas ruminantium TaxID=971 RepID=A0A1I3BXZ2_SELRU|nr:Polysaccharide pyruvyl transferase [Selenomonas ruminantium]
MYNSIKNIAKNNKLLYAVMIGLRCFLYTIIYNVYVCVLKVLTRNNVIISECFMRYNWFGFKTNNWGDDLNKFLWEYVTSMKFVSIPYSKLFFKFFDCYSLIGSIISFYDLDNKIVYGSGLISPYDTIKGVPKKIYSVRGPLTREYLLKAGIECPDRYGDPGLLLPLFYSPKIDKKKNGSVILNMGTIATDSQCFCKLCDELNLNVISLVNYDKWTDVIDEIVNSEFVISESLHGLIVAETYGVPNVWVEFKDHPNYWTFKFNDYFYSIGKEEEIIQLQKEIPYEEIMNKIKSWKKGEIDYRKMLSYMPFNVKCPVNFEAVDRE